MDSLVFETLIPKPMMQHYIGLLLKHRRLVLSGPSGTGKTYLTNRLAEYLVERSGREVTEGIVSTFNMHQQSCKVALPLRPPPPRPPAPWSSPPPAAALQAPPSPGRPGFLQGGPRICRSLCWPLRAVPPGRHGRCRGLPARD